MSKNLQNNKVGAKDKKSSPKLENKEEKLDDVNLKQDNVKQDMENTTAKSVEEENELFLAQELMIEDQLARGQTDQRLTRLEVAILNINDVLNDLVKDKLGKKSVIDDSKDIDEENEDDEGEDPSSESSDSDETSSDSDGSSVKGKSKRSKYKTPIKTRSPFKDTLFIASEMKKVPKRSSKSSSKSKDEDRVKAQRRLSMKVFDPRDNIMVVENNDHLKIKWSHKSVNSLLNFLEEMEKFQLKHNQEVRSLFSHLSIPLQEEIIRHAMRMKTLSKKYRSRSEVFKIIPEDLVLTAMKMFTPRDTKHFLELLGDSCSPYAVFQDSRFYDDVKAGLDTLRLKFEERFYFLHKNMLRK